MKSNCYSLLLVVLGLLLLSFTVGCGQSQVETVPAPSTAPDESTSLPATEPISTPTPPPAPAHFVLAELTITPTVVKVGEVVTISIAVSNTGGTEGSYTVVFKVKRVGGWTYMDNVEVTLKADQTKTVTFTTTKNESGTYTVDVHGKIGQFTVTEPAVTTPAPPTPEELEAKQVIEDLAYIKAYALPYSDDADPKYEGVSITVSYHNSKSERIYFTGVPVNVTVELYMWDELIYRKQRLMDSNATFHKLGEEMLSIPDMKELLRIPYEALPTSYDPNAILVVVATTPTQGVFEYRGVPRLFWNIN